MSMKGDFGFEKKVIETIPDKDLTVSLTTKTADDN